MWRSVEHVRSVSRQLFQAQLQCMPDMRREDYGGGLMDDEYKRFLINLGYALRSARRSADITQGELAKAINTSQNAISSYERGKVCMSVYTLAKICKELNMSTDELITLD